ncbi:MAG: protein kinase [Planctomycetes bacterium]|nr:protein kinase [Planctomycetota bacterium]
MPSAQDHAFALLIARRGAVSPDALARAQAALTDRPGHTLAQALLEARLLPPALVAETLRELARSSYVCQPCHDLRSYDALAQLAALRCPSCGGALAVLPVGRDSRLGHTMVGLADTAVGPPSFARPARPSGSFVTPARPSGSFVTPARPGGAHPVLPSGAHPVLPSGAHPVLPSGAHPALPAAAEAERAVGPYTIVRELGRGSNGVVYLARRPGLERAFAVKVLLHGDLDPDAAARFEREALIASKIGDPGVIGVFDVGRHGGHPFYAMEYCPGETLEQRLRRGPLPPAEAARLVEQLARTVHAAHGHAVIHRDLKPANVILEEGAGRPKILDFGLARDRTRLDSLTRSGEVLGTPYYMAPEQIRGDRDIDHRIDVYALGVILFECLTARRPFQAATVVELAQKIRGEEPPAPRALRPDVPEALEAVCLRAMAKRPEARHPTARHLADALAEAAGPPAAPTPALGESSGAAPAPRSAMAAPLVGAAALALAAAAAARRAPAPRGPAAAVGRRPRGRAGAARARRPRRGEPDARARHGPTGRVRGARAGRARAGRRAGRRGPRPARRGPARAGRLPRAAASTPPPGRWPRRCSRRAARTRARRPCGSSRSPTSGIGATTRRAPRGRCWPRRRRRRRRA